MRERTIEAGLQAAAELTARDREPSDPNGDDVVAVADSDLGCFEEA